MKSVADLVTRLNQIEWLKPREVSPEADALIQEHLRRIRTVIRFLVDTRGLTPCDAYSRLQSAGYSSANYDELLKALFEDVQFAGVGGVREALILTIASSFSWEMDPELNKFHNPWEPLVRLYELGYTSTFEEGPDGKTVDLVVGLNGGEYTLHII